MERLQSGHVLHAALEFLLAEVEPSACCPITMTYAAPAALKHAPDIAAEWLPRILASDYDPSSRCVPDAGASARRAHLLPCAALGAGRAAQCDSSHAAEGQAGRPRQRGGGNRISRRIRASHAGLEKPLRPPCRRHSPSTPPPPPSPPLSPARLGGSAGLAYGALCEKVDSAAIIARAFLRFRIRALQNRAARCARPGRARRDNL